MFINFYVRVLEMMSSISAGLAPVIKIINTEGSLSTDNNPGVGGANCPNGNALALHASARGNREYPEGIINAFTATERRFGEYFDVSTHAAVIKMMMLRFGQSPVDVFDHVTPVAGGYEVIMKDGFKVHLTQDELELAAGASRFDGDDPAAINDANFIFAAFVKRKQLEGPRPSMSNGFDAALAKTLEGETPQRVLKGMGMVGFMQHVGSDQMRAKGAVGVVDTQSFAAALVLEGVKHDRGKPELLGRTYGYMLTGDDVVDDDRSIAPGSVSVSGVAVGVPPTDIWGGFYQGFEGNCVTISAIKAAMMKFGQNPTSIYKHIRETADGYEVTMRDGYSLRLTHDELKQAEQGSNFKGSDEQLIKDANFLYAVSAKRAQRENHEFRAQESFEVAMETLNNGEYPGEAFRRLGLYAFTRPSTAQELADGALGTLASSEHSVAVINGKLDLYGDKMALAASQWNNSGYRAIKLVGGAIPVAA